MIFFNIHSNFNNTFTTFNIHQKTDSTNLGYNFANRADSGFFLNEERQVNITT